ncbi:cytochrome c3 family protein [Fundidesulfovibrio soli]|uniref:cytochrome c3 family protein n=1 Tax=Fundidesulfovibrio soli TaxID=2922716 RepID=UPI001FAF6E67|nr:cytochrome c3 family protein [Fundidesulfovibrio soli]
MSAGQQPKTCPQRRNRPWGVFLSITAIALFGLTWWGYRGIPEAPLGPIQPLPFSHRVHAGVKTLSCLMCHNTVQASAHAGIPPVETCMLCHSRIIITYPDIQALRAHYYDRIPLLWNRVNILSDFVKFNHSQHINRSVDCGHCHGDVKSMDRIKPPQEFRMGFCMTCHKAYNATHDCFTCHR